MVDRTKRILEFWFGQLDELGRSRPEQRKRWWTKSESFDQAIESEFLSDYEAIVAGTREAWRSSAHGALAYIIVLDQFSRNMFRGTPKMFAADERARKACREGLDAGFDTKLCFDERVFFYLPLEHSEDMEDQLRCRALFEELLRCAPAPVQGDAKYYLDFAERHKAIIERFGRYPHRNEILGRASTAEEIAFLEEPGSSF
ncbi:MAG: DUF924 family protein [Polyangiales bacterium]